VRDSTFVSNETRVSVAMHAYAQPQLQIQQPPDAPSKIASARAVFGCNVTGSEYVRNVSAVSKEPKIVDDSYVPEPETGRNSKQIRPEVVRVNDINAPEKPTHVQKLTKTGRTVNSAWQTKLANGDPNALKAIFKRTSRLRQLTVTSYPAAGSRRANSTAWLSVPPTLNESIRRHPRRRTVRVGARSQNT
jgi:hypothetical protein